MQLNPSSILLFPPPPSGLNREQKNTNKQSIKFFKFQYSPWHIGQFPRGCASFLFGFNAP